MSIEVSILTSKGTDINKITLLSILLEFSNSTLKVTSAFLPLSDNASDSQNQFESLPLKFEEHG